MWARKLQQLTDMKIIPDYRSVRAHAAREGEFYTCVLMQQNKSVHSRVKSVAASECSIAVSNGQQVSGNCVSLQGR